MTLAFFYDAKLLFILGFLKGLKKEVLNVGLFDDAFVLLYALLAVLLDKEFLAMKMVDNLFALGDVALTVELCLGTS